ncbi:MAG: hypothetical protein PXX77_05435, partial [Gallionella sp.]|nr:hypothetical protein [Gallionella sp.]
MQRMLDENVTNAERMLSRMEATRIYFVAAKLTRCQTHSKILHSAYTESNPQKAKDLHFCKSLFKLVEESGFKSNHSLT